VRGLLVVLVAWVVGVLAAPSPALAQVPAIDAAAVIAGGPQYIGEQVEFLREPTGRLSLDDVIAGRGGAWQRDARKRLNFAYDDAHFWLRFSVRAGAAPARLVLNAGQASLDRVELHVPRGGAHAMTWVGDTRPWSEREVAYRHPAFRIEVPAGETRTFYLKVVSDNSLALPLSLWSEADFGAMERRELLFFGLFFGMVAALFFYNLFIWASLRDRTYLWYVGYVACFGMVLFVHEGFAFQYLWPGSVWWANHSLEPLIAGAILFAALFVRQFLEFPVRMPRADRLVRILAIFVATLLAMGMTGAGLAYPALMHVLTFISATGLAVVLWVSWLVWQDGFRPARYLLLAWGFLLFFVVMASLRHFAMLPINNLSLYGMHLGLAADVLLLSIAMTTRIGDVHARMIAAQKALIDASRTYQETLERRARELASANRELESFSHTVAHDLRAPLRAIDGYTSLIDAEHGASMQAELRRDFAAILRNTRRMARLVDGLLEFARLGRVVPVESRVDMDEMARSVAAEAVAGQAIRVECANLPALTGDPLLLRQVWTNLIENAVKFSARVAAPEIRITCETTADDVVFAVADNGAGFDPTYVDKLFGMFQRLHAAGEFEGTGVGLATVKRIVERHGGRVWAEGRPGAGARFLFALPATRLAF
jgi:signal transduction histidine kinase